MKTSQISRRDFLGGLAAVVGSGFLSGCDLGREREDETPVLRKERNASGKDGYDPALLALSRPMYENDYLVDKNNEAKLYAVPKLGDNGFLLNKNRKVCRILSGEAGSRTSALFQIRATKDVNGKKELVHVYSNENEKAEGMDVQRSDVIGYVLDEKVKGAKKLYAMAGPKTGSQVLVLDENEKAELENKGFKEIRIVGYAFPAQ